MDNLHDPFLLNRKGSWRLSIYMSTLSHCALEQTVTGGGFQLIICWVHIYQISKPFFSLSFINGQTLFRAGPVKIRLHHSERPTPHSFCLYLKETKSWWCEEGGEGEEKVHLLTHATARGGGKNTLQVGVPQGIKPCRAWSLTWIKFEYLPNLPIQTKLYLCF